MSLFWEFGLVVFQLDRENNPWFSTVACLWHLYLWRVCGLQKILLLPASSCIIILQTVNCNIIKLTYSLSMIKNQMSLSSKKGVFRQTANNSLLPANQNYSKSKKKTLKIYNQNTTAEKPTLDKKLIEAKPQPEHKRAAVKENRKVLGQSQFFRDNVGRDYSKQQQKKQVEKEYFAYQNYSFRRLSDQHRVQALQLLTESFIEEQPLAKSFYKQFPEEKLDAYEFWEEYWDMYMEDAIQSGISLAIVDTDKNEELIGVYTFKNFNYLPPTPRHTQKYLKGFTIISSEVVLQEQLIQHSSPEVQDLLLNSQNIAEAWAAAIKKQHTGKSLYNKLTTLAEQVLRNAGFEYALVFASNFISSKVLRKLQFSKLAEVDCEQFDFMGAKPFAQIEEMHRFPSLWFKKLNDKSISF